TQQFMCPCHRLDATIECRRKIGHRAARTQRVGNDGTNGRERVLDAMVKLSEQDALLPLHPLTLGYIDVDTISPLGLSIAVVRNQLACLDPPDGSIPNNSVFRGIFAPPFTAGLVPKRL